MKKIITGLLAGAALCALGATAAEARPHRGDNGASFSITLGDVLFGYSDGYYDRNRGWHRWRNDEERGWYRSNYRGSYYEMRRDRDRDRHRRDWRNGRSNDWRGR